MLYIWSVKILKRWISLHAQPFDHQAQLYSFDLLLKSFGLAKLRKIIVCNSSRYVESIMVEVNHH